MTTTFKRGPLTDRLLVALTTLDKPVGDMVIPPHSGWQGQPNVPGSTFIPYVVLVALTASRNSGPLGDSQADWQIPYMIESFGATRAQCEWMADEARGVLDGLRRQVLTLSSASYRVQQVRTDSIGAVNRVAATDPPFYGQQDGITVWLAEELS